MTRRLCSRCLGSFDDADLAAVARELLCRDCREAAARPSVEPLSAGARPGEAEPAAGLVASLRSEAVEWCRGRSWAPRVPLLAYFAYALVRHWADPMYADWFKPLNLGIHELGHFLFRPLGMFLSIAGGSVTQCLVPVLSMAMFRRQGDWFAIAVCFGWLSLNLFDVATYAADARSLSLPLVSPGGGEVYHDWNYLLEKLGLLRWDGAIAFLMRTAATAAMAAGLAGGGWLLWRMARGGPGRSGG